MSETTGHPLPFHISREEQKKRFKKLEASKGSAWRVNKQDWKRNKEYDSYLKINEEMLENTDTEYAPWTIIESTDRDYAAMKILTTVADRLAYALEKKKETAKESKKKKDQVPGERFHNGVLSGIVEPLAAVLTMLAAGLILPALPYLLGFAAGAMIYVVVEQLIPEASAGEHSNLGTMFFAAGFTIMLALDVALG